MSILKILVLSIVQGAAELLPVSSSAHVILTEKLMHLDPTSPELTFLLVMLHTGTMFAVILYFWPRWKAMLMGNAGALIKMVVAATLCTGVMGLGLKALIEKIFLKGIPHAEIEQLFGNLPLMAVSLFLVGCVIIAAGSRKERSLVENLDLGKSLTIGIVQGLCLPFRGFSRSGATISTGLFLRLSRAVAEDFSFILAVVLTPPVVLKELHRLLKSGAVGILQDTGVGHLVLNGLLGMGFSFVAGLVALRFLSKTLEGGGWKYFGFYCIAFSGVVLTVHFSGL